MSDAAREQVIPLTIKHCARCGWTHEKLAFIPLINPPAGISHYATCPKTEQPIMLAIRDDGTVAGDGPVS